MKLPGAPDGAAIGESPPTRGRGLKPLPSESAMVFLLVAPHAGARIETASMPSKPAALRVAPHAGARIETLRWSPRKRSPKVAPHAGARIETEEAMEIHAILDGRPPRGGAD